MFSLYLTTERYLIWQPNLAHFLLSGNIKLQSDIKVTGKSDDQLVQSAISDLLTQSQ